MKKLIALCTVLAVATVGLSTGVFSKAFATKYSIKPTSALGQAKCGVCHAKVTGGALNKYGKDLKTAAAGKPVTAAVLAAVESKDSNGNGKTNIQDIKADVNPGK